MDAYLLAAPPPFAAACGHASRLQAAAPGAVAELAVSLAKDASPAGAAAALAQRRPLPGWSQPQLESAAAALAYALAGARKFDLDAKQFRLALDRHTDLALAAADELARAFAESKGPSAAQRAATPTVVPANPAKLLGMEWSLGVTAQSSTTARVGQPFVTVRLRVEDRQQPGGFRDHTMDLSVLQARALHAALRDGANALDSA